MIVEVLQNDKRVDGSVGDHVAIDPAMGSTLACFGVVRVVSHGETQAAPCTVERIEDSDEQERLTERGREYLEGGDEEAG
jgi:hypothetical protein